MKNFFYIILFLPFISIGQNDVTPKIACDLITDYERAKEFTLKYLNTMPADKYSYKPTPEILSFRDIFLKCSKVFKTLLFLFIKSILYSGIIMLISPVKFILY